MENVPGLMGRKLQKSEVGVKHGIRWNRCQSQEDLQAMLSAKKIASQLMSSSVKRA